MFDGPYVVGGLINVDPRYAANRVLCGVVTALRTAKVSAMRVMPLIIRLTPTRMPIAHSELEGHCM